MLNMCQALSAEDRTMNRNYEQTNFYDFKNLTVQERNTENKINKMIMYQSKAQRMGIGLQGLN